MSDNTKTVEYSVLEPMNPIQREKLLASIAVDGKYTITHHGIKFDFTEPSGKCQGFFTVSIDRDHLLGLSPSMRQPWLRSLPLEVQVECLISALEKEAANSLTGFPLTRDAALLDLLKKWGNRIAAIEPAALAEWPSKAEWDSVMPSELVSGAADCACKCHIRVALPVMLELKVSGRISGASSAWTLKKIRAAEEAKKRIRVDYYNFTSSQDFHEKENGVTTGLSQVDDQTGAIDKPKLETSIPEQISSPSPVENIPDNSNPSPKPRKQYTDASPALQLRMSTYLEKRIIEHQRNWQAGEAVQSRRPSAPGTAELELLITMTIEERKEYLTDYITDRGLSAVLALLEKRTGNAGGMMRSRKEMKLLVELRKWVADTEKKKAHNTTITVGAKEVITQEASAAEHIQPAMTEVKTETVGTVDSMPPTPKRKGMRSRADGENFTMSLAEWCAAEEAKEKAELAAKQAQ